jgi:hypothetical protein
MSRSTVRFLGFVVGAVVATTGTAAADSLPRLGVMLDAGVPDGGTASLVYRPLSRVRLSAGVSHNIVGPGVRGGITLSPLNTWIRPTIAGTYGRYFERDANPAIRMVTGDDDFSSPQLEKFGYDYADAHVGLELGRKRVTFYLNAGITRVTGNVRNLDEAIAGDEMDGTDGDTTVTFTEDPSVTMTTLSARFGFVFYIK